MREFGTAHALALFRVISRRMRFRRGEVGGHGSPMIASCRVTQAVKQVAELIRGSMHSVACGLLEPCFCLGGPVTRPEHLRDFKGLGSGMTESVGFVPPVFGFLEVLDLHHQAAELVGREGMAVPSGPLETAMP